MENRARLSSVENQFYSKRGTFCFVVNQQTTAAIYKCIKEKEKIFCWWLWSSSNQSCSIIQFKLFNSEIFVTLFYFWIDFVNISCLTFAVRGFWLKPQLQNIILCCQWILCQGRETVKRKKSSLAITLIKEKKKGL